MNLDPSREDSTHLGDVSAPPVLAIVGSTATGKSDLAVALAHELDGEIVNADSMQVYRGMDIGTAKLSLSDRKGIPHHLLDVWDVRDPANVAMYQCLAREVISEIRGRGKQPIVVGGSGLYVRAIFDDLVFPGTDAEIRTRLQSEADQHGVDAMFTRLQNADPAAAAAILPTNIRRIIRALEVIELTGRPFTASLPDPSPVFDSLCIGLQVERSILDERINDRVDRMWDAGFVAEVFALEQQGLRQGITARQALGYAQILAFLDGHCGEQDAVAATKAATRKFARRQESWFRRDPAVRWVDAITGDLIGSVLAEIHADGRLGAASA